MINGDDVRWTLSLYTFKIFSFHCELESNGLPGWGVRAILGFRPQAGFIEHHMLSKIDPPACRHFPLCQYLLGDV